MWVPLNFEKHRFKIDNLADEFAKYLNEKHVGIVIILKDTGEVISAVGWKEEIE